jgi:hypothetical protein
MCQISAASVLIVLAVLFISRSSARLSLDSNNPDDVQKYFCDGADQSTATNIRIDIDCDSGEIAFIGDLEVSGCKTQAGGSFAITTTLVPSQNAAKLTQSATTTLGKLNVGMPGLKKEICDGSQGPCAVAGTEFSHSVALNVPGLIPFQFKGKPAKYTVKDPETGKNLACVQIPLFIQAGVARSLRKKN